MHKKIDNAPGFVKDTQTGAILNTNVHEIKRKKELLAKAKKEKAEIQQLKSDVAEIKDLLRQILNK